MTICIAEHYNELFHCLSFPVSDSRLGVEPKKSSQKGESIQEK